MSRPTTQRLKDALAEVNKAQEEMDYLRKELIELIVASTEVDDAEFIVENQHRWEPPSEDRSEVLFARLNQTKERLSRLYTETKVDESCRVRILRLEQLLSAAKANL